MTRTDLVTEVIRAVAAADGVAVSDVPPLYEYVDPDILDKLDAQDTAGNCRLTFQFADHEVTVTQDSQVFIDGTLQSKDRFTS